MAEVANANNGFQFRYDCTKGSNTNYWVYIGCKAIGTEVVCEMPEQMSISIQNEFESRLPFLASSVIAGVPLVGEMLSRFQGLVGENFAQQDLSYQMWMGSTPIEIPLQLQFDARRSGLVDVWNPVQSLVAMSLPTNRSGAMGNILTAPGPIRGGTHMGEDGSVTVRIGKMFTFIECSMVSVEEQWDSKLDKDGYPIAADVNITIRTSKIIGKADWAAITGRGAPR